MKAKASEPAGVKLDTTKVRMDLCSPVAQTMWAAVLTKGAAKYTPHNWRQGIHYSRIIAAIQRHTTAIQAGEDLDAETGLPHAAHIMAEASFLCEFYGGNHSLDDRFHLSDEQLKSLNSLLTTSSL